ncbi:MAG: outer membrane protein assembly factor BamE [Polaromonas sp.]
MSSSAVNPVNWITPYRMDVIQGNFVSKEQVEQLQAGMTRDQVKAVLGTPLLASLFHADRWDYVFTLKRQGVEPQSFKYTVFFKGDQLERFGGDAMPSEAEFISTLSNKRTLGKVPVLEATEEQLKAAEKSKSPVSGATPESTADSATVPAGSPATVYPPLESPKQ